ncbi:MAG: isopentenyl phosphate kinase family protein [Anaerolineaceae bacterium]|nr:isopentenyl phosphate kinase family protein [Anaerolineaceae bacterium]
MTDRLYFLKLGGSLITEKSKPRTARENTVQALAKRIKVSLDRNPGLKLLIGHGSGSFGHASAARHGTRDGVHTPAEWQGFLEVWRDARALNQIVMDALSDNGLPVLSLPPSASVQAEDGVILNYPLENITTSLANGLIPVIYGDVTFDLQRGATILSTEELFIHLARVLHPEKILLAGRESGVWADFPVYSQLVSIITPTSLVEIEPKLRGSLAVDVTGGMYQKVVSMLELVKAEEGLEVLIFSGEDVGALEAALDGEEAGTLLCNQPLDQPHGHD